MWPIVVREEHRMYFLTSSHMDPFNFDCSLWMFKRWKTSELEHSETAQILLGNTL